MKIEQVFRTEDGSVFATEELAASYATVLDLAKRLVRCPHVTTIWPYDDMITAAKWLLDEERFERGDAMLYRVIEETE